MLPIGGRPLECHLKKTKTVQKPSEKSLTKIRSILAQKPPDPGQKIVILTKVEATFPAYGASATGFDFSPDAISRM